jgi:hypothetical protein
MKKKRKREIIVKRMTLVLRVTLISKYGNGYIRIK